MPSSSRECPCAWTPGASGRPRGVAPCSAQAGSVRRARGSGVLGWGPPACRAAGLLIAAKHGLPGCFAEGLHAHAPRVMDPVRRRPGVVHTHAGLHAQTGALIDAWGWQPQDRILHALPLHHVHGFVVAMLCGLEAGAAVEFMPRFSPAQVWQRVRVRGAVGASLEPGILGEEPRAPVRPGQGRVAGVVRLSHRCASSSRSPRGSRGRPSLASVQGLPAFACCQRSAHTLLGCQPVHHPPQAEQHSPLAIPTAVVR